MKFSTPGTEQQYREREQLLQNVSVMEPERPYVPVSKKLKTENEDGIEGWDISFDTPLNVSMDDMHGNFDDHSLLCSSCIFSEFSKCF